MSWDEISPETREILRERLTDRELEYIKLVADNPSAGREPLAAMLSISPTRIRQLKKQVARKLVDVLLEAPEE